MTNEEAIEVLCGLRKSVSMCLTVAECRENNEAIDIAVKAIEKQIPKKPRREEQASGVYYAYCASCGNLAFNYNNYCPDCGQALDWSEE